MRERITKRKIDELRAAAQRDGHTRYVWDKDLPGFGLVVTKAGRASYCVQYRLGGRSRRVSIGKHGPLTLDEARRSAREKLGEVARGIDIAEEKKETRRKLKAGNLGEATERYLTLNGKGLRYWNDVRRLIEFNVLPSLGRKPVVTITRSDIAALIDDVAQRSPAVARYVFAAIRPMFGWFVGRGLIEVNPIIGLKAPPAPKARDRVLDDGEIKTFWDAAARLGWPFEPVFKLLLLTATRREEIAAMAWDEIDLAKGVWTLPGERAKNSRAHTIDLAPAAVAILEALPRLGELVFTTTGETAVSGFSKAKQRLDGLMAEEAGRAVPPWRTHDLRRTAATRMAGLGFPPHIVERVLNHISGSQGGLVSVYQRHEYREERRNALLAWARQVETITDGSASNVVSFVRASGE
jgi:integrase